MDYYFSCECGHKTRVSPTEAGTAMRCAACRKDNTLPSLSKLSREMPRDDDPVVLAKHVVDMPANMLIITSLMWIACLLVVIPVNIVILTSGTLPAAEPYSREIGEGQVVGLRMLWGIAMLIANGVILSGAICMKRLRYYSLAKTSAFLAVIPFVGPCYVIGIPFGIMALSTLNRDQVRDAFTS